MLKRAKIKRMRLSPEIIIEVSHLARLAGEAILSRYTQPNYLDLAQVHIKSDHSPVTVADKLASEIIVGGLKKINQHYHLDAYIISEEEEETHQVQNNLNRLEASTLWLVDPLDGTKEFMAHTHEFTVNIALVHQHEVILGVIYVPYYDLLYYAQTGQGAFLQSAPNLNDPVISVQLNIEPRDFSQNHPVRVISSRRHGLKELEPILNTLEHYEISYLGSSWKLGKIAEGKADVYPRLGPTSEWDTAAGQIILMEAGGELKDFSGNIISYNTKNNLINPYFIGISQSALYKKICG